MHRLSRRSVSAIRRAATRYRPISSSFPADHLLSGESDTTKRWCSVLTTGSSKAIDAAVPFNLKNEPFLGCRHESTAAASDASTIPAEKYEYPEEVSCLMIRLMNTIFSRCKFLNELIRAANDALHKLHFLSDSQLLQNAADLDIRIQTDKDTGIITITDTGIGMTLQELVDYPDEFLYTLKDYNYRKNPVLGFLTAFLVSKRVEVSTKSPKSDKQYVWEGDANSSFYTIREETDPAKLIPRGTCITLYLGNCYKEFARPESIQELVKKYSYSYGVSVPIYTWQEKGYSKEVEDPAEANKDEQDGKSEEKKKAKTVVERYWDWELIKETQPIWLRNPKEVVECKKCSFYSLTFASSTNPPASLNFTTEGEVEFSSILYVPDPPGPTARREPIVKSKTKNIRLYVKQVFISDDFDDELLPWYLSFIKGVVDSKDLPLNVSREILKKSDIVPIMKKCLVRKALDMILGLSLKTDYDYQKFWDGFGRHLKLGCIEDPENRNRIAPLLRFFSSKSVKGISYNKGTISLDEYVENMKPGQKHIYFLAVDNIASARSTPFMEKLVEKDIEVLFLVGPLDEDVIENLIVYKNRVFIDISKSNLKLGDGDEEKEKEIRQEFSQTCDWIKKHLGGSVLSVQVSNRLVTSPCVVVSLNCYFLDIKLSRRIEEQIEYCYNNPWYKARSWDRNRVFEINPEHPIIKSLSATCKSSPNDEEALRAIDLLYETALISSGYTLDSPGLVGGKIFELLNSTLLGKSGSSADVFQHPAMATSIPDKTVEGRGKK